MSAHDCFEIAAPGQVFLRLCSAREQRALPYTLLTEVELSDSATILRLVYPHYQVTVHGRQLGAVFEGVTATKCIAICVGGDNPSHPAHARGAAVTEIRIKRATQG